MACEGAPQSARPGISVLALIAAACALAPIVVLLAGCVIATVRYGPAWPGAMLFLWSRSLLLALSEEPVPQEAGIAGVATCVTGLMWLVLPYLSLLLGGIALYRIGRSEPRQIGALAATGAILVALCELAVLGSLILGVVVLVMTAS
jgi:hypothetical protein